jgi:opacity protein-like surface antigen
MIRKSLVALLLVSLIPVAAQAQSLSKLTHRTWEISVFGGGSYIGERLFPTPVTGSSQQTSRTVGLSYASGSQFGLRVTENRWQHWGAAMEYGFSNQPLKFTNLSDAVPLLALGHSIHRFKYDFVYYPFDRSHRLRPFAFAGSGASLFVVKGPSRDAAAAKGIQLNDPWKLTVSWGGGVKYLIRDQLAASFQFSDGMSGVPHYGLPPSGRFVSSQYSPGFQPDGRLHNRLISLSFIYQWGSR